jgi:hypothetical protein
LFFSIRPFINPIANPAAALPVNGNPKLVIGRRVELLLLPAVVIIPVRDDNVIYAMFTVCPSLWCTKPYKCADIIDRFVI